MARKKRDKKWKRQRGLSDVEERYSSNNNNSSNNIEEDLRLQRLRQQTRIADMQREEVQKEKEEENESNDLDDENDVEIPITPSQSSLLLPQHLMVKGEAIITWPSYYTPNISSLWIHSILQQSPGLSVRRRVRLGQWAASKHLLEHLQIGARASTMYSRKIKWADHALPNEMHCSWDMTCKHHLHPSARTLDVVATFDDPNSDPTPLSSRKKQGNLPSVATVLQGGWGIFQPSTREHSEPRIQTLRCKPVHAIRMHEKSQRLGAIVRSDYSTASYKFHWYSLPHAANYVEADLQTPVHDFCFGNDLAVFACPRYGGSGRNSLLSPLFLPLDHPTSSGLLRSLDVQNFPQSDALRVEMSCQQEKYLAFGHRNGQVSLLDLRQSHTCSAIITSGSAADFGSATDLAFLSSQTQLLVKRAFGPCQLHDLRKLSPCPSSLLRTLTLPEQNSGASFHKTLSANCNGFCVDPLTQETLVSPFINSRHQPCLGVWSLTTGDMVGNKVLYKNPKREVYFVELCSKTTLAFHDRPGRVMVDPSSFGAWMKCGRFSDEKLNSKVGSIHHVTFPGRWIKVDE